MLSAHPNIVGAKFSHGDVSVHAQVALDPAIDHTNFAVFTGLGQHLFPVVQVGCAGAIDGLAGFFPASVVRLYELAAAEMMGKAEREEARRLQWAVSSAEELLVKWGVVGIKEAISRVCGFGDRDGTRLPLKVSSSCCFGVVSLTCEGRASGGRCRVEEMGECYGGNERCGGRG
jgi:2-keto-3-deoxy-L-rhamnonate aldolase